MIFVDVRQFQGRWYILESSFGMWAKGDKEDVSIVYDLKDDSHFEDVVFYRKGVKEKNLKGVDLIRNSENLEFTWHGKGLKFFLRGNWKVEFVSEDDSWAVLSFEETPFSKAGIEIICRHTHMHEDTLYKIHKMISNNPRLGPYLDDLKHVIQH